MGDLTTSLVVSLTSFLLGTLAVHWSADHLIIWQAPVTHDNLIAALHYYHSTLLAMSSSFRYALHGTGLLAATLVIVKMLGGRESNWLFDGASLFLYGSIGIVYHQKIVANLSLLPPIYPPPPANPLNPHDVTLTSLRELASSNAVLACALVGVLILQCGQYYSERLDERERVEEVEARVRRRRRRQELQKKEIESAVAAVGGDGNGNASGNGVQMASRS